MEEERETGDTCLKPYIQYLKQSNGLFISRLELISVYSLIGCGMLIFLLLRSYLVVLLGIKTSIAIFSELMTSVFRAPISFYDSTPLGRILSRGLYFASAKELMQIEGRTKSSVASHLAESVAGAVTIGAFGEEGLFFSKNLQLIDANASSFFHKFSAVEWLFQCLEIFCAIVLSCSVLGITFLSNDASKSGFIGMALSYGLSLNTFLVLSVQSQCTMSNSIIAIERLEQYMHIPSENPEIIEGNRPALNWPEFGKVEIRDLKVRYSNSPLVLQGISCVFEGGDKIGIVGRTGSGKITLINALFRLVEPTEGSSIVDGINKSILGLHDLRSYNLDPSMEHTDQEIWAVLEKCQLQEAVQEKDEVLDALVVQDRSNWSMGRRQLFYLGRVLLQRRKILAST